MAALLSRALLLGLLARTAAGQWKDSDEDGIPDVVEGRTADSDGDGLPNHLDADSDGDTIPDSTEGTADADNDGVPNFLDTDSDNDNMPDRVEGATSYLDATTPGPSLDSDGDNIPDVVEGAEDPDGDGQPNYLDIDSDGDTIPDSVEGTADNDQDSTPNYLDTDSDGDGRIDRYENLADWDGDGQPNYLDLDSNNDGVQDAQDDSDNDGIADGIEGGKDGDNDGNPNYLDKDSDGDGRPDLVEGVADTDADGVADFLDTDSNNDGVLDADDDSDNDGMPDVDEGFADADGDGMMDYLDPDGNGDGVPDSAAATGSPCGFETNLCGWVQTGRQSWTRGSSTPSSNTGPSAAHSGLRFVFLEASNDQPGERSELCSPLFSDELELIIWHYHMFGATMGSLSIVAYPQNVTIWSETGQSHSGPTSAWTALNRTLPNGTDQVCFRADRGAGSLGDMAVDTVYFTSRDSDGDGILDSVEGGVLSPATGRRSRWWIADPDEDDVPNYLDTDSDGDGVPDVVERDVDSDGDGTSDYLDFDSDADGVPDAVEGGDDADSDGIPNYLDTSCGCLNAGACNATFSTTRCQCASGWEGQICQDDFDECVSGPCQNGAACTNLMDAFICECVSGFAGDMCERDIIDECLSAPCQPNGACDDSIFSYSCECTSGWTGENCHTDVDECSTSSSMCLNQGECVNTVSSFLCSCRPGFDGASCEVEVVSCDNHPENHCDPVNGICTVIESKQVCTCKVGYEIVEGSCKPIDYCNPPPCANGVCVTSVNDFHCNCTGSGWNGNRCQLEVDECLSQPCSTVSSSGCTDLDNAYSCHCNDGWNGHNCETNMFTNTRIAFGQDRIEAAVFTTTVTAESLTIVSNGTSPLFILSVSADVPWATIFQNAPGDSPDYKVPILPGQQLQLFVQFDGGSAGGIGNYTGTIMIRSNAPGNAIWTIPIAVSVTKMNLQVVAMPSVLAAVLRPSVQRRSNISIFNTMVTSLNWTIGGDCACSYTATRSLVCSLGQAPWIRVANCNGSLPAQKSEDLAVILVSPTVASTFSHAIQISNVDSGAAWSIATHLRVQTSPDLFSTIHSSYSVSWDDNSMLPRPDPDTVLTTILDPRDRWNNHIDSKVEDCVLQMSFITDDVAPEPEPESARESNGTNNTTGRRLVASVAQMTVPVPVRYSYAAGRTQAQVQAWRNGTFRLRFVTRETDLAVQPAIAKARGEWQPNMSDVKVYALKCNPPRSSPNALGNNCLLQWCQDAGYEVSDSATSCTTCLPGRYSDGLRHSKHCVACPRGTFCADYGCTECTACATGMVSTPNRQACAACPHGTQRNRTQSRDDCVSCPYGTSGSLKVPGTCVNCLPGQVSDANFQACTVCPVHQGLVVSTDGFQCQCAAGYYSVIDASFSFSSNLTFCTACAELAQHLPKHHGLDTDWDSPQLCAGGPVGEAHICPTNGLYIHVDATANHSVQLLPCEGPHQCLAKANCDPSVQVPAVCGRAHRGWLCADCLTGYSKVAGRCLSCSKSDWVVIAPLAISALLYGGWLLMSTVKAFPSNLPDKKYAIDSPAKSMAVSDVSEPAEHKSQGAIQAAEIATPEPSASTFIWIFYLQTLSLVIHRTTYRGHILEWANFDWESTMDRCLMPNVPLTMQLLKVASVPLGAAFVILVIFSSARLRTCSNARAFKPNLHHLLTALMQLLISAYAPITRMLASFLLCREVAGQHLLVLDMSVQCYTGQHVAVSVIASCFLVVYGLGLPLWALANALPSDAGMGCCYGCWDTGVASALRGTTRWWCGFMLLLKLGVNIIAMLARVTDFRHNMWLQLLFICATFASFSRPYSLDGDNYLQTLFLLSLTAVISVGGTAVRDNQSLQWEGADTAVALVLFVTAAAIVFREFVVRTNKQAEQRIMSQIRDSAAQILNQKHDNSGAGNHTDANIASHDSAPPTSLPPRVAGDLPGNADSLSQASTPTQQLPPSTISALLPPIPIADKMDAAAPLAVADNVQEFARVWLKFMRTSELRKRVISLGVDEEKLSAADDAQDRRIAFVKLILEYEKEQVAKKTQSTTSESNAPPEPGKGSSHALTSSTTTEDMVAKVVGSPTQQSVGPPSLDWRQHLLIEAAEMAAQHFAPSLPPRGDFAKVAMERSIGNSRLPVPNRLVPLPPPRASAKKMPL